MVCSPKFFTFAASFLLIGTTKHYALGDASLKDFSEDKSCPELGQERCDDGDGCYFPKTQRCDRRYDCNDRSDEHRCYSRNTPVEGGSLSEYVMIFLIGGVVVVILAVAFKLVKQLYRKRTNQVARRRINAQINEDAEMRDLPPDYFEVMNIPKEDPPSYESVAHINTAFIPDDYQDIEDHTQTTTLEDPIRFTLNVITASPREENNSHVTNSVAGSHDTLTEASLESETSHALEHVNIIREPDSINTRESTPEENNADQNAVNINQSDNAETALSPISEVQVIHTVENPGHEVNKELDQPGTSDTTNSLSQVGESTPEQSCTIDISFSDELDSYILKTNDHDDSDLEQTSLESSKMEGVMKELAQPNTSNTFNTLMEVERSSLEKSYRIDISCSNDLDYITNTNVQNGPDLEQVSLASHKLNDVSTMNDSSRTFKHIKDETKQLESCNQDNMQGEDSGVNGQQISQEAVPIIEFHNSDISEINSDLNQETITPLSIEIADITNHTLAETQAHKSTIILQDENVELKETMHGESFI